VSDRSECGFTLIEVTLATVITGIIVGAIGTALVIMLTSYPRTANRLAQSDNAQLLSSWLVPDIQSASGGDGPPSYSTPHPGIAIPSLQTQTTMIGGCKGAVPLSATVLRLTWADPDLGGTLFIADYRQAGSQLVRWYCQGGSSATPTIVGRDIASAQAIRTMDSVDVKVQTTKAITDTASCGSDTSACYSFDVVVSRRTPALRIWALPMINNTYATEWSKDQQDIAGTAAPDATNLTLTIADQGTPAHPPIIISNIQHGPAGDWSLESSNFRKQDLSFCNGVSGQCGLDGMLSSSPFQAFNEAFPLKYTITATDPDGNQSSATTTTVKDMVPPQVITPVSGPALATPSTPLTFTITWSKQVTPLTHSGVTVTAPTCGTSPPCNVPTWTVGNPDSQHSTITVAGLDTTDDRGDGNVTMAIAQNAVAEVLSGNGNPPFTYTFTWDANAAAQVSGDAFPTSDSTIQYLATFPPLAAGTQLVPADFTATPPTVAPNSVQPAVCLPNAPVGYQCFNVSVPLSGSLSNPQPVSLTFNGGTTTKVLDQWGQPVPASPTTSVTWTNRPLTIIPNAIPGSGTARFSGIASTASGDGTTVSVDLCKDFTCSSPTSTEPPIVIGPGTMWSTAQPVTAPSNTYWALVTQTQAGIPNPVTVMTGPFTT
jgi:hypothetical protein